MGTVVVLALATKVFALVAGFVQTESSVSLLLMELSVQVSELLVQVLELSLQAFEVSGPVLIVSVLAPMIVTEVSVISLGLFPLFAEVKALVHLLRF